MADTEIAAASAQVAVTFFTDFAAATKREEVFTLPVLASRIKAETASEKKRLPWLKLGRFGDLRTSKNSLRHDRNLIAVGGLEADYDGGCLTFDEAVEILTKAGVMGNRLHQPEPHRSGTALAGAVPSRERDAAWRAPALHGAA